MRKLMALILLVLLLSASAGFATYAWFTSSSSSGVNTFYSGTLSINKITEIPSPLFYSTPKSPLYRRPTGVWYPGMVVGNREMTIENNGNLQAKVCGVSAKINNFNNPNPNVNAGKDFNDSLIVTIKDNYDNLYFSGTLSDLVAKVQPLKNGADFITLEPKGIDVPDDATKIHLHFEAKLDELADNDIQGITADVDIIIHATQVNDSAVNELLGIN